MQQRKRSDHDYIMDIQGPNAIAEYERLKVQEGHIAKSGAMKLLPKEFGKWRRGRILDLGSGAGRWCMDAALACPNCEVIGTDINGYAVQYCNDQASINNIENLEFQVMDILQPLDINDESCDLVNARLLTGVCSRDYWPTLMQECLRVLKPGGILRFTEPTTNIIARCPAAHELALHIMRALYRVGKTFSEYEYGIAAELNRLFRVYGLKDVQLRPFILDCSAWAPLHESILDNMIVSAKMMKSMVTRYAGISDEEFNRLLELTIEEHEAEDYSNLWEMMTIQGYKG